MKPMATRNLRVPPLDPSELTDEVKEALGPRTASGKLLNIYARGFGPLGQMAKPSEISGIPLLLVG